MIYLGDLTIEQMESRSGVVFPEELKVFMKDRHQPEATGIKAGKWHCFDLPFMLVCGDMKTAQQIYDHLSPMAASFSEPLQIGVQS